MPQNQLKYKWNYPQSSTGKERDSETGYSYFGARFYDSDLMTGWLSVDPMADKYPNLSPYAYCAWNPVKLVDPDGEEISPIYDTDGKFLGTDDNGLQGEALIMNKADFRQGMSNKEARTKGRTLDNMSDTQALKFANNGNFEEFLDHYNSLSSRPDWDGFLTLSEANDWYRNGNGESLYVDATKISLFPVTTKTFEKGEGSSTIINFLGKYFNPPTGLVYGQIKLTLLDKSTGEVKLGRTTGLLDNYGFEQHPNGDKWRNFATKIGGALAGNGKPFDIYTYNTGTVWH